MDYICCSIHGKSRVHEIDSFDINIPTCRECWLESGESDMFNRKTKKLLRLLAFSCVGVVYANATYSLINGVYEKADTNYLLVITSILLLLYLKD